MESFGSCDTFTKMNVYFEEQAHTIHDIDFRVFLGVLHSKSSYFYFFKENVYV
jgi:hypothetical protein